MTNRHFERARVAAVVAAAGLTLAACGGGEGSGDQLSGPVKIDGSSTVEPLSSAAAELFMADNQDVQVTVGTSGTGGGFEKFCAGETDISDASRPIKDEEKEICEKNGIKFSELQVANDALTVVANPENDWAKCLTVEQLKKIWNEGSKVKSWKEIDSKFPDEELVLYGPGPDSGTFDYFTDEINGEEGVSRTDYESSENDNVLVNGVADGKGALGYFGLSYFEANQAKLKAVEVDGGDGCVAPSAETAQAGDYKPLARPLFIYVSDAGLKKPQVTAFVDYYLNKNDEIVDAARFVKMTEEQKKAALDAHGELKSTAGK